VVGASHVAGIAALVLEEHPDFTQGTMERTLRRAAAGLPLPASDAVVSFPFIEEGSYNVTWDGGDYGKGFLQADAALSTASRVR
jgi:acyl CoA:acetate/3-ketoacid CoA transferase alpha subunit